jgi:3-hydroxybutyryl-CoA dehydratase
MPLTPTLTGLSRPFVGSLACNNRRLCDCQRQITHRKHSVYLPAVEGSIPWGGEGLAVGQFAVTRRIFSSNDIHDFARITGDRNPLHEPLDTRRLADQLSDVLNAHPLIIVDENGMTKEVVHGILLSSLFSCIFGTLIPGSVYRSQTLDFRRPVFVDEAIHGRVQIIGIEKQRRLDGLVVRCSTHVMKEEKECVRGEAEVWIHHGTLAENET